MGITRWGAWAGIAAAPLAAWMCGAVAIATAGQLQERWTVDGAVVLAIAGAGAAIAAYLTFTALLLIVASALRGPAVSVAARVTPRAWRSLVSAAVGAGIAVGITAPSLAAEDADVHLGWVAPAADVVAEPVAAGGFAPELTLSVEGLDAGAGVVDPGAPVVAGGGAPLSLNGYGDIASDPAPAAASDPASASDRTLASDTAPSAPSGAAASEGTYVVERGDSLWRITKGLLGPDATDAEIAQAWPELYEVNRSVIGSNPSLIYAGQVLQLPGSLA